MAVEGSTAWSLEKYARYITVKKGSTAGQWKHYDDIADSRLVMTLTETNHLVVLQGSVVLESHSLVTARAWMRGMCKNDSLLFMYKHGKGTRRFKVKYAGSGNLTASQVCSRAAQALSKLFTVHITPTPPTTNPQVADTSGNAADSSNTSQPLNGEMSLGTMAHIVLGETQTQLPESYKTTPTLSDVTKMTSFSGDVMADHLRLFLADPTFPAFVEQVDEQLKKIITECKED
ncbi:meiotic recombination protein REC114-like [Littorina saxatilis]|uniref:Uncharacterized protein n=1 Tax=Littorina saxatilis TaxID=31220 RepID=A0AAN9G1I6_9CAEN